MQYRFATDSESGYITADDFTNACQELHKMLPPDAIADGAWGWVADECGIRYSIPEDID